MLDVSSLADRAALSPTITSESEPASAHSRWRQVWPLAAGVLVIAALLIVGVRQQGSKGLVTGTLIGTTAPDFTLTTFAGSTVRLSEQRGHPVVINFWASWCPPCRAEAATLSKVAQAESAAGRAVFIGVDVRDQGDSARRFLSDFSVPYANGPDPGNLEASYQGIGIPYTVFIGADGTVARAWIGPLDEQRLTTIIDEIA